MESSTPSPRNARQQPPSDWARGQLLNGSHAKTHPTDVGNSQITQDGWKLSKRRTSMDQPPTQTQRAQLPNGFDADTHPPSSGKYYTHAPTQRAHLPNGFEHDQLPKFWKINQAMHLPPISKYTMSTKNKQNKKVQMS